MIHDNDRLFGCQDLPDKRDWAPGKLLGTSIPAKISEGAVDLHNMYALDQGYENACTACALSGVVMTMINRGREFYEGGDNLAAGQNTDIEWGAQWMNQFRKENGSPGTADRIQGDYLQSALKTARVFGVPVLIGSRWIKVKLQGYARISSSQTFEYLERGFPVYTGFSWVMGNNSHSRLSYQDDDGFLFNEGRSVGGHAVFLCGKVSTPRGMAVKGQNSHGEKWGKFKNGTFLVDDQKLSGAYSQYIVRIDWNDLDLQLAS